MTVFKFFLLQFILEDTFYSSVKAVYLPGTINPTSLFLEPTTFATILFSSEAFPQLSINMLIQSQMANKLSFPIGAFPLQSAPPPIRRMIISMHRYEVPAYAGSIR